MTRINYTAKLAELSCKFPEHDAIANDILKGLDLENPNPKYGILGAPTRFGKSVIAQIIALNLMCGKDAKNITPTMWWITSLTTIDSMDSEARKYLEECKISIERLQNKKSIRNIKDKLKLFSKEDSIFIFHDEGDYGTERKSVFSDLIKTLKDCGVKYKYVNVSATPYEAIFAFNQAINEGIIQVDDVCLFTPHKFPATYFGLREFQKLGLIHQSEIFYENQQLTSHAQKVVDDMFANDRDMHHLFVRIPGKDTNGDDFRKIFGNIERQLNKNYSPSSLRVKENSSNLKVDLDGIEDAAAANKKVVVCFKQTFIRGSEIRESIKNKMFAWHHHPVDDCAISTVEQSLGRMCNNKGHTPNSLIYTDVDMVNVMMKFQEVLYSTARQNSFLNFSNTIDKLEKVLKQHSNINVANRVDQHKPKTVRNLSFFEFPKAEYVVGKFSIGEDQIKVFLQAFNVVWSEISKDYQQLTGVILQDVGTPSIKDLLLCTANTFHSYSHQKDGKFIHSGAVAKNKNKPFLSKEEAKKFGEGNLGDAKHRDFILYHNENDEVCILPIVEDESQTLPPTIVQSYTNTPKSALATLPAQTIISI